MKNKEIELILTKLRIVRDSEENGCYISDREHSKLLLSYIEQLENNRDKTIEEINYLISNCDISDYQGEKLKNILKGGSDEFWSEEDMK